MVLLEVKKESFNVTRLYNMYIKYAMIIFICMLKELILISAMTHYNGILLNGCCSALSFV